MGLYERESVREREREREKKRVWRDNILGAISK